MACSRDNQGSKLGVEMKDPKYLGTAGVWAKPPFFKISKEGGNKSINMNGQKGHEGAAVKHKLRAFLFGRLN